MDGAPIKIGRAVGITVLCIIGTAIILGLCVAGAAGCKSYNRAQARADANNRVKITHIEIRRAQQQAQINNAQVKAIEAEARKRVAEAHGIRKAQDLIAATLTSRYLQHEAIQAQKAVATSGENNTIIYVPSGEMGVPLVQDPGNVNRLSPTPPR